MRLSNHEAVASGLEAGLGELHWLFGRQEPTMRLRMMGACGVVSVAIAGHMPGSELIISQPRLSIDPTMTHVFLRTPDDYIIDANYTIALQYAGLTPGYVLYGGQNTYPEEKIAVFPGNDSSEVVSLLTRHSRIALDGYVKPEDRYFNSHREFEGMSDEEIREHLAAIWNPVNFHEYVPEKSIEDGGRRLAKYILPEDVKLIV